MPARRARRTATLDEFLSTAREAASQVRSGSIDLESLLSRLADIIVERSVSRIESLVREGCKSSIDERMVAEIVREAVVKTIEPLERRLEALEKRLDALQAALSSLPKASMARDVRADGLPGWAKRIARRLEAAPYVRLHDENVDVYTVRSSLDVLRKLNAILVETVSGVYLVRRDAWQKLLEALASIRARDEEAAIRAAGPLAEVVAALLRSNMLYYNNGWRVLRDAYIDPL